VNLDEIKSPAVRKAIADQIAADDLARRVSHAQPQPAAGSALDAPAQGKEKSGRRITVRVTRYARKLLDADNFAGGCKPIIDQLRYTGHIPDDNPAAIKLEFEQEKVRTKKEEGTRIELA
jgi:hypothetical protein